MQGRCVVLPLLLLLLLLLPGGRAAARCPHCPACPPPPAPCQLDRCGEGRCLYSISGVKRVEIRTNREIFFIGCKGGVSLDDEALPCFEKNVSVADVTTWHCAPPAGSFAAALRRLGVALMPAGRLLATLPGGARLPARLLRGLGALAALDLDGQQRAPARADLTLLQPLQALTTLALRRVALPAPALQRLPDSLLELTLVGVTRGLPALALPRLEQLELNQCSNPAPTGPDCFELVDTRNATLTGVCDTLRQLRLCWDSSRGPLPPPGWLAGCGALETLALELPTSRALPEALLRHVPALTTLTLLAPRLRSLPRDLLHHTPRLTVLYLSGNLTFLPEAMFSRSVYLTSVDLSGNALSRSALALLRPLPRLRHLALDRNPLGDLCPRAPGNGSHLAKEMSPLVELVQLETLSLAALGVTRICPDWRKALPRLASLDLTDNRITTLEYADLWWEPRRGGGRVRVQLQGNPLGGVRLPAPQPRAAAPAAAPTVQFEVSAALRCDCRTYRLARALRERRLRAEFVGLRCLPPPRRPRSPCSAPLVPRGAASAELPFDQFHLDDMVCPLAKDCPRGCYCDERGDETLRVECALANLTKLPELRELPGRRVSLCVASSRVARLPPALPARLAELDLRDNELLEPSAAEVAALLADNRTLQLAGNPLLCGCPSPLLQALPAHLNQVKDADSVRCADNRTLHVALHEECEAGRGAPGEAVGLTPTLVAVALLVLAAVLLIALRRNVLRLKAALLARGLCLYWAKPRDDDDSQYDVFLAFSHHDAAVAEEIKAELEAGAAPLRLCVHHRDWRPGDFIPAQIALSVARSKRTVVLLSENFVKSSWARAEFREAHARSLQEGAVRLVAVVLGDAPPRGLEPDMQHYVANNTYLRWGEPAFWERLRLALPPPRRVADPSSLKDASNQTPLAALRPPSATSSCEPPLAESVQ